MANSRGNPAALAQAAPPSGGGTGAAAAIAKDATLSMRPSLDHLIGYRLRRVHGAFVEAWKAYYAALDLAVTPVQGGILMLIARYPGTTQSELARRLEIEAPTLHESLRRLVDNGLVRREPLKRDRRAHALTLSDEGAATEALIRSSVAEQEAIALSPLSVEERQQLATLLGRVLAAQETVGDNG